MDTFHLEILSPETPFYKGDCLSLVLPISDGMIGIMAHHPAMTAVIGDEEAANGTVKIKRMSDGEEKTVPVEQAVETIAEMNS